jgi:hypothetical protein
MAVNTNDVNRLYQEYLGRPPESETAAFWASSSGSEADLRNALANSQEFTTRYHAARVAQDGGPSSSPDAWTPERSRDLLNMIRGGADVATIHNAFSPGGVGSPAPDPRLSALEKQLAEMQSQYDRLVAQQSRPNTGGTGGTVGGGGLVDDGSTLNPGQTGAGGSNLGNTGKVYGPDGTEYSSAAAALAAGVMNFTFVPPQRTPGLISGADTLNSQFLQPAANTGNVSPGANIANQNLQLFQMGAPKVKLPGQIPNPFAAR